MLNAMGAADINLAESISSVQEIFSEITRYPLDVLDPDADLENDMGIDSVKLGEILSVLRERFNVSIQTPPTPDELRTIRLITQYLGRETITAPAKNIDADAKTSPVVPLSTIAQIPPSSSQGQRSDEDRARSVATIQGVFAEITRYPIDVLDPDADLEGDLGIDSVKLGEVLSVLRERFAFTTSQEIAPQNLATIRGLASVLDRTEDGMTSA